ncbi:MAG: thiamine pyrophosphate-dependent dehydrogenase E1 component subunit alpha [Gemmatimonas sp.]|nr:thiamine pyrophosphate-dependent dehydrogenase E1 component subunit alpha [Gemmatimonas sp.]
MASTSPPPIDIPHQLDRDQLLDLYRYLRLTRGLEERLVSLHRQSKVVGGLFRSLGQEGESVASAFALNRRADGTGDILSPLIRNLGSMLVMGAKPVQVLRQYMAKGDSPTGGKELNIHFTSFQHGYLGQISSLGDLVPIMTGVTLTFKLRGEPRVGMVYVGDGATSTGAFHEGVNFAAVQRCPLVTIIENNGYAYSTPYHKQTAATALVEKAAGYGIPGVQVDGNDVLAVYGAVRAAVDRARAGGGTSMIEVMTYRRKGHAEHDAQPYQPPDEIDKWATTNDPIDRFVAVLRENGWADDPQLEPIDARVEQELDAAVSEAEASPLPDPEDTLSDVYAGETARPHWTRQVPPNPRFV